MTETHPFARLLMANSFFAGLGRDAVEAIAGLCSTKSLGRDEVLFLKGDEGAALYALRRGQVRIGTGTDEGRHVTLNLLGPGDVFGEIALLDGHARTADAVAVEPSELFVVQRRDFLRLLEGRPALAIRIVEFLCQRLRWVSARMEETALLPLDARLARRLLMLAEDYGAAIAVTQHELAAFVGAARESVNRQLQDWQKTGLVALSRGQIEVRDAARLAAIGSRAGET